MSANEAEDLVGDALDGASGGSVITAPNPSRQSFGGMVCCNSASWFYLFSDILITVGSGI